MTGHPLNQMHAAVLQERAGCWIQKPFALAELAGRVRAVLDAAQRR
jgi:DNA-binding response OmpR family regulator